MIPLPIPPVLQKQTLFFSATRIFKGDEANLFSQLLPRRQEADYYGNTETCRSPSKSNRAFREEIYSCASKEKLRIFSLLSCLYKRTSSFHVKICASEGGEDSLVCF